MSPVVLDAIPFKFNLNTLIHSMMIRKNSPMAEEFEKLAQEALSIAKPKGMYRASYIDSRGDDHTVIDGVRFNSRVMAVNLKTVEKVFPGVVTCGSELEQWSKTVDSLLHRFWADSITYMVLESAAQEMRRHMKEKFKTGKISFMSPGSLADWPITEQNKLFHLLGNTKEMIGIESNENSMMIPLKSVSGINFPARVSFESCQLCPRKECPTRRAPHDEHGYEKKYA